MTLKPPIYYQSNFEDYAQDLLKIRDRDACINPFRMNAVQRIVNAKLDAATAKGRCSLFVLKARQTGISTLTEARIFHKAHMFKNQRCAVFAHDANTSENVYNMARMYYDNLPETFRPLTRYTTKRQLVFENPNKELRVTKPGLRSRIDVFTAGTKSATRSYSLNAVHFCLDPSTPIISENGILKPISEVECGDVLLTHTGQPGLVTNICRRHNPNPNNEALSVSSWLGGSVRMTPQHKVYTQRGWLTADKLTTSDYVTMPIRQITNSYDNVPSLNLRTTQLKGRVSKADQTTIRLDYDFGLLIGYYLAEGCLVYSYPTKYGSPKPSCITFARDIDETEYINQVYNRNQQYFTSRRDDTRGDSRTIAVTCYGSLIAGWIAENFGATFKLCAKKKHIPDWVFNTNKEFLTGLLTGYLAGDGSKSLHKWPSIYATSIRSSITTQIRDIAASLGIGWGSIDYKQAGLRYGRNESEAWTVRWHGDIAKKLHNLLGINYEVETSRSESRRALKWYSDNNYIYTKIKSIESCILDDVIDIEIDHPDHSFRTTYFSVSNSEFALYPNGPELYSAVWPTMPDRPGNWLVIETTAQGVENFAYDEWKRYKEEYNKMGEHSSLIPIFIAWYDLDDYSTPFPNDNIKSSFMGDMEPEDVAYMEHFDLSPEQMWWRNNAITQMGGDVDYFNQEFPACFVAGTKVSSEEFGIIDIESHPKVITNGIKSTVRLTTDMGYTVDCTTDHPFMTGDGYKRLNILNVGDVIKLKPPTFSMSPPVLRLNDSLPCIDITVPVTEDLALFAGIYTGDGSLYGRADKTTTLSIAFDKQDLDVVELVSNLTTKLFKPSTIREVSTGGLELRCNSTRLGELFTQLDLASVRKNGKIKRSIKVPNWLWKCPKEHVRLFLRGLFETDGYAGKHNPRIALFTKEKQLAQDVQFLLLGFGITSKLRQELKKKGDKIHVGYSLNLRKEESKLFRQEIGFLSERKNNRLKGWLLDKAHEQNKLHLVLEDRITSIESLDDQPVYDITTSEHCYSAQGLWAHNSDEMAFMSSGRPIFSMKQINKVHAEIDALNYWEGEIDNSGRRYPSAGGPLHLYVEPRPGRTYTIGVDTVVADQVLAPRTDMKADKAVLCVIDDETLTQVAEWAGRLNPILLAGITRELAKYYNNATVVPERNNSGLALIYELQKDYFNIYRSENFTGFGSKLGDRLGFETNIHTKKMLIDFATFAFHNNYATIKSVELLNEMRVFVDKGMTKTAAADKKSNHDDRVMAWMLGMFVAGKDRSTFNLTSKANAEQHKTIDYNNLLTNFTDAASIDVEFYNKIMGKTNNKYNQNWMTY